MNKTAYGAAAATIGLASLLLAGPAAAQVSVFVSDEAHACYLEAKYGDPRGDGIHDCTDAMFGLPLAGHDRAGTLVNRGVIYMRQGRFARAQTDLTESIKTDPALGEAYVNLGATLIAQRRYAEGVANIDHGLPLSPQEPEKAYYNRGLADEALDDVKAAYFDYLKASQLNPNWAAPRIELTRFTVSKP